MPDHVPAGDGGHAAVFSGDVRLSDSGRGGVLRQLFGIVFAGGGAVRHRHLYLVADREPGNRGGGLAGDRAVFAVCQQLHAGGFERMDQRGDGRNFLLPALSGLHQGAAQPFRPDLLCQRDGAVFIFDGAASGTPQNLVGRGKKR